MLRFVLTAMLAATAAPAFANDSTAELGTGGLVLSRTDAVEMQSEDLFLSRDKVTVDYVFKNTSDNDIDTIVAFPMPDIEGNPNVVPSIPQEGDNFLGFEATRTVAFAGVAFTILIAFLLVSRLPVHSGKSVKIRGDRMLPVILAVVLYFLLLVSYPWHTLTASVAAYLVFLPFSMRAYSRRAAREGEGQLPPDVDARPDGEG